MARWDWEFPRHRRRPPRPAEGGIAARKQRGVIGETWWSARFVAVLESFAIGSRLRRGRSYARSGQVLDLEVEPGIVYARVQGSRRVPYDVRIRVKTLSARAWTRLEQALASQAMFAARLLAGEMPHEIEDAFATLNLSLFPARASELETDCSCPDFANPCKHIAATFYILAEAFDDDPFLIFAWRGRTCDQLVANLRRLRGAAVHAPDTEAVPDDPEHAADTPPLAASIGDFWRIDPAFTGLHLAPHASDTPDALLRQLGSPPPEAGGQRLLERLSSAYRAMAEGAEHLAYDVGPGAPEETADIEPRQPRRPRPPRDPRYFVTDLRHFLAEDDEALHPAARRLATFFGSIVRTGTSIPGGVEVRTPLKCRRSRGRSPCRGRLTVRITDIPSEMSWTCAVCGEGGVLHGWECTDHDLGGRGHGVDRAELEVILTEDQYRQLERLDLIDVGAEQLVRGAQYESGAILLAGSREEFDALIAEVAVALGLTRDPRSRASLERLHRLLMQNSAT